MKTTIHLALAISAVALFASCTQESIISREYDPDQIAYKAFANNATKSGAVDNDHLGNIGNLYISAIKLNDGGYYFSNNVISSSDVSSSTANPGNTPYYWPTYKLGFYAANRSLVVDNSGTPVLSPYIPNFTVSRRVLNDPDELMVALEAQQRDGNGTPVQLGLHHALSRLTIQVQKTIPGYDISVAGVQIGGFKSVGTFTFPQYNTTNATSDADWEGLVSANYGNSNNLHSCWGSLGTPLQYGSLSLSNDALSGTAMTSTAQNVMGGNYFYVIPQSVTLTTAASGNSPDITSHYIDLLVNVRASAGGVQVYPASADAGKYAVTRIYIPGGQVFEAGKSYTVTLDFSNGVGVSMSNLSLYDGSSYDLSSSLNSENFVKNVSSVFPDNTFILGSTIDYVASVSEWIVGSYGGGQSQSEDPVTPPVNESTLSAGALPGRFTVNSHGQQVHFSKGNLQCYVNASGAPTANGSATTGWRFAEHQYDFLADNAANTTIGVEAGWVDLFGWPSDISNYGISMSWNVSDYDGTFKDWGNNAIYNGTSVDPAGVWYTLSADAYGEWSYILGERSSVTVNGVANARFIRAEVNSVHGLILFPDEWTEELSSSMLSKIPASKINLGECAWSDVSCSISSAEWDDFEAAGCVFLPAACSRYGQYYDNVAGDAVRYWASGMGTFEYAPYLYADSSGSFGCTDTYSMDRGLSVRLVCAAESTVPVHGAYGGNVPNGAVPGVFTIDWYNTRVRFSKGNLQCYVNASGVPTANGYATSGWKFADHQWSIIGRTPGNIYLGEAAGWIDLFGFSTAATTYGISTSVSSEDYSGEFVDWGGNAIFNGTSVDQAGKWFTLSGGSTGAWYWMLEGRSSVTVNSHENARYVIGKVNSVHGLILFPDEWVTPLSSALQAKVNYSDINSDSIGSGEPQTNITASEWAYFEASGCVFLPAAAQRYGKNVNVIFTGPVGNYWTTSIDSEYDMVYALQVYNNYVYHYIYSTYRYSGFSVRLVTLVDE